jgi:TonB-like protein
VIRLSAAVADGQLLFLTNKKTGKEVVTQVVRKRSFRPTSCYVDLEFTEASPGFWGIEFPMAAPTMPSQNPAGSSEDDVGDSAKRTAPPDLQEVERLKKEVSELQTRLKTLIGSGPSAEVAASAPAQGETLLVGVSEDRTSNSDLTKQHEEKMLAELLAQAAEQEKLQEPKRLVAYPKKGTSSAVKTAGKIATAGAFAAVIMAAGVALWRFGLLDSWIGKSATKPVPHHTLSATTSAGSAARRPPSAPSSSPSASPVGLNASSKGLIAPDSKAGEASPTTGLLIVPPMVKPAQTETAPPKVANVATEERNSSARTKSLVAAASLSAVPVNNSPGAVTEGGPVAGTEEYVGPKLLRAVKPVSPPEALRNYITGNVSVDALVDVTGRVKSVTVISGPKKLWNTAIDQMRQYVYEPARKNGKPVMSHVQTSLQYWYEP